MLPYTTFLNGANTAEFWDMVKWVLFYIAPIFMIWLAIEMVGRLILTAKDTVDDDEDHYRKRRYDDDDYY